MLSSGGCTCHHVGSSPTTSMWKASTRCPGFFTFTETCAWPPGSARSRVTSMVRTGSSMAAPYSGAAAAPRCRGLQESHLHATWPREGGFPATSRPSAARLGGPRCPSGRPPPRDPTVGPVRCSLGRARVGARQVIQEIDQALRALIRAEAFADRDVEVVFDAPTKEWAGRRNAPTVDVYLYDIREDMRRRARGVENEYDGNGRIVGRHLPPRHFKLSYLVTAWTQRPEDEHRLLSALLACFLRHDSIPPELLTSPLSDLGLPVPLSVGLPPPEDRAFADVWSALGGELKPSLDVVVTAPTDTGQRFPVGPPVTELPEVSAGGMAD